MKDDGEMPLTLPLVGHGLRRQVEEVLLRAVVHKYNAPQCHDAQRLIKKKLDSSE